MRAMWNGALSFGLIYMPVKLYKASEERALNFDLLHKKDLSPIRFARICKSDGKEVPYSDLVKGYEYQKGDYVILTDEDFKKVALEKTKLIEIQSFTNESAIDPIFYEKPYYLEPEKKAGKAYSVLREALKKSKKVAIAKYVLQNREHIGVIRVMDNVLVLEQLRYLDEIRQPDSLDIPKETISSKEISMALQLIDQLSKPFDPSKFHDTYTDELKEIIEEKAHGKKRVRKKGKEPKASKTEDIMSLLKESLEQHHHKKTA